MSDYDVRCDAIDKAIALATAVEMPVESFVDVVQSLYDFLCEADDAIVEEIDEDSEDDSEDEDESEEE